MTPLKPFRDEPRNKDNLDTNLRVAGRWTRSGPDTSGTESCEHVSRFTRQ